MKYLYVEADEDHIALQYKEKKGDVKRYKGHADNGQIVKLVYVHEEYAILVREEFSCLINSHEQGHEQLDSGKLNTGGH